MPKIFPVQKCKCCGKYYFIEEEQYHVVDIDAFVDTLNYQELKEAMEELSCSEQSEWEMFMLNRSLIYAYNNEFIRNHNNTPSNEDRQLFMTAIDNLLGFPENYYYPAFRGELLRESGRFDEAVEVLSKLSDVDNIQYYVKPILEHAINHDPLPLLLIKDNNPLYL